MTTADGSNAYLFIRTGVISVDVGKISRRDGKEQRSFDASRCPGTIATPSSSHNSNPKDLDKGASSTGEESYSFNRSSCTVIAMLSAMQICRCLDTEIFRYLRLSMNDQADPFPHGWTCSKGNRHFCCDGPTRGTALAISTQ